MKRLFTLLGGAAVLLAGALGTAQAATSVSWTSPADGSVFPEGTFVAPTGIASATGQTGTGLDLALVLDSSGSMQLSETVGGVTKTRAQWQKDAAIALVNNLPVGTTAVTVVEFDSDANTVKTLTQLNTDIAGVIAAINSVDASGGTFIGSGIQQATSELTGPLATAGRAKQMVVFSDGQTSGITSTYNAASFANSQGITVNSVALPGASLTTMQNIASFGGGTFFDASTATGLQDLIDLLSGAAGNLVGIDKVEIILPDGTVVEVPVGALGNFTAPNTELALGPNTFVAVAYGTDGTTATATLTLIGEGVAVSEPGILGLMGLGLVAVGAARVGRRRQG